MVRGDPFEAVQMASTAARVKRPSGSCSQLARGETRCSRGVGEGQGFEPGAHRNPLAQLAEIGPHELFLEFRLAGQDHLQHLALGIFEVGQQPHLFEHIDGQILGLIDDQQRRRLIGQELAGDEGIELVDQLDPRQPGNPGVGNAAHVSFAAVVRLAGPLAGVEVVKDDPQQFFAINRRVADQDVTVESSSELRIALSRVVLPVPTSPTRVMKPRRWAMPYVRPAKASLWVSLWK